MRLKRLIVSGFGLLPPGLEIEFAPGLNVLCAPNESGKSTLAELITALFYGFGKRKAGVHPLEPWTGQALGPVVAAPPLAGALYTANPKSIFSTSIILINPVLLFTLLRRKMPWTP